MDRSIIPAAPVDGAAMISATEPRAEDVVREAAHRASVLKTEVLDRQRDPVVINGRRYARYEDWQTLARFYSLSPLVTWSRPLAEDAGYEARAEVVDVRSGIVVSAAEAECLRDEPRWRDRPSHQLRSMAQTRACAKALRNALAWVMVLAGVAGTPAEEMGDETRATSRRRPSPPAERREAGTQEPGQPLAPVTTAAPADDRISPGRQAYAQQLAAATSDGDLRAIGAGIAADETLTDEDREALRPVARERQQQLRAQGTHR